MRWKSITIWLNNVSMTKNSAKKTACYGIVSSVTTDFPQNDTMPIPSRMRKFVSTVLLQDIGGDAEHALSAAHLKNSAVQTVNRSSGATDASKSVPLFILTWDVIFALRVAIGTFCTLIAAHLVRSCCVKIIIMELLISKATPFVNAVPLELVNLFAAYAKKRKTVPIFQELTAKVK